MNLHADGKFSMALHDHVPRHSSPPSSLLVFVWLDRKRNLHYRIASFKVDLIWSKIQVECLA